MQEKIPLLRPFFDFDEIIEIKQNLELGRVYQGPKTLELINPVSNNLGIETDSVIIRTSTLYPAISTLEIINRVLALPMYLRMEGSVIDLMPSKLTKIQEESILA